MPVTPLFDLADLDLSRTILDHDAIYKLLPQKHEFALLSSVCHEDKENIRGATWCEINDDQWWVRGHVPGNPLFPGVLMLEAAAQSAALFTIHLLGRSEFVAYGGVDQCKFRDTVKPPAKMLILCTGLENRPRRIKCACQGWVGESAVFEAIITGLPIPRSG